MRGHRGLCTLRCGVSQVNSFWAEVLGETMADVVDSICDVCRNGDSTPGDEIVFCDGPGCSVTVHQTCYGVGELPTGEWRCAACVAGLSPSTTKCALCPGSGGAMKPVANVLQDGSIIPTGEWCHVLCASWIPETHFDDEARLDHVLGVLNVRRERWSLKCTVCGKRQVGACVQCADEKCAVSFHPSCMVAPATGVYLTTVLNRATSCHVLAVFCEKHAASARERQAGDGDADEAGDGSLAIGSTPRESTRQKSSSAMRQRSAADPSVKKKSAEPSKQKPAAKASKSRSRATPLPSTRIGACFVTAAVSRR